MGLLEAVADASGRLDAAGAGAELGAETAHDDVHDVASTCIAGAPDVLEELSATDRSPVSVEQGREHAEFQWRQLDPMRAKVNRAIFGIEERLIDDAELGGREP